MEELVIEGRFEATVIHREFNLIDSIRFSDCIFKGRLLQLFYKDSIYVPWHIQYIMPDFTVIDQQ